MNKRYGASLALVVGLVAGCSGGSPQNLVTGNGTPTSHSPVSQPPVDATVPEAARANTLEGAEAFALYYFDLYNRISVTGALPDALTSLSDPMCLTCAEWSNALTAMNERKQYTTGSPLKMSIRTSALVNGVVAVAGELSNPQYQVIGENGAVLRSVEERPTFPVQTQLKWTNEGWRVAEVAPESEV